MIVISNIILSFVKLFVGQNSRKQTNKNALAVTRNFGVTFLCGLKVWSVFFFCFIFVITFMHDSVLMKSKKKKVELQNTVLQLKRQKTKYSFSRGKQVTLLHCNEIRKILFSYENFSRNRVFKLWNLHLK